MEQIANDHDLINGMEIGNVFALFLDAIVDTRADRVVSALPQEG